MGKIAELGAKVLEDFKLVIANESEHAFRAMERSLHNQPLSTFSTRPDSVIIFANFNPFSVFGLHHCTAGVNAYTLIAKGDPWTHTLFTASVNNGHLDTMTEHRNLYDPSVRVLDMCYFFHIEADPLSLDVMSIPAHVPDPGFEHDPRLFGYGIFIP